MDRPEFSTPTPVANNAVPKAKSRRIKIFHLITSLEVGGAQNGLLLGLPRLGNDRYEHVLCSIMDRMQMAPLFRSAGIEVQTLGLSSKYDLLVANRLRTQLRKYRPDILHTYLLHANVLGRIVGRLAGVETIIGSERTIGQARRWGKLATRLTNPLTDAVEVNSETASTTIEVDLGVSKEKIEVVRSGLDLVSFSQAAGRDELRTDFGVAADHHLMAYVGRLRTVKGVEYGIRAFASAIGHQPNIHLVLAGEGDQRYHLESVVKQLGVDQHVTFLGARNDVPALLAAADSVLLPSLNEGFPRTAIEAMAAGKPIIGTRVGGTPEAVIDGETGILVPPADVAALSDAIVRLVTDTGLQEKLGNAGRRRAEMNYSIANYVSRLDEMYRKYSGIDIGPSPAMSSEDSRIR